jgi:hypothetical protein
MDTQDKIQLGKNLEMGKINEDEILPCGLTVCEYNNLSDADREKLWKHAYQQQLKITEIEMDVNPHVLSPRQRRRPKDVRRLEQLRKRQSAHANLPSIHRPAISLLG